MASQTSKSFFSFTLKIQVKSGRTLRCGLTGKRPGPLRVHLEGLSCTIENAEKNKFVRYYAKNKGPVLCVELANSAASNPEHAENLLSLEDHMKDLLDCVKQVRDIFELRKPREWSGHSLGATVLLHAATRNKLPRNSHIEVISPYSKCLSYYVMDKRTQRLFNYLRSFQNTKSARILFSHIAFQFLKWRPDPQMKHVLQNPLHMQASLEFVLPILGVDFGKKMTHKIKKYRFHLVTAEDDDIIPPIVHLHIYERVLSMGAEIRMTVFENHGHFLPYEVDESDLEDLFSRNRNETNGIHSEYIKILSQNSDLESSIQLKKKINESSQRHLNKRFSFLLNTQNTMNHLRSYLWNSTN